MLLGVEGVLGMRVRNYPQLKFGVALAMEAIIAPVLCAQCVRTYWYTEAVLVPQQAEHEAVRQAGALSAEPGVLESRTRGR
jgi:hypothetical protein